MSTGTPVTCWRFRFAPSASNYEDEAELPIPARRWRTVCARLQRMIGKCPNLSVTCAGAQTGRLQGRFVDQVPDLRHIAIFAADPALPEIWWRLLPDRVADEGKAPWPLSSNRQEGWSEATRSALWST